MTPMLVSSTEKSPFIRALGKLSTTPEQFGVDVLARAGKRFTGYQRKAIGDLIQSLYDGRIAMERAQWNRLLDLGGRVVLVIEGRLSWTREWRKSAHPGGVDAAEEVLAGVQGKPWPRRDYNRFVYSVSKQGVVVVHTDSERHTAEVIEDLVAYERQERTGSRIPARPGPKGRWGTPSSREWAVWLLSSTAAGMGAGRAEALLDAFDGRIPMAWTCEYEDLLAVPGIGKKTADALWRALNPLSVVDGIEEEKVRRAAE